MDSSLLKQTSFLQDSLPNYSKHIIPSPPTLHTHSPMFNLALSSFVKIFSVFILLPREVMDSYRTTRLHLIIPRLPHSVKWGAEKKRMPTRSRWLQLLIKNDGFSSLGVFRMCPCLTVLRASMVPISLQTWVSASAVLYLKVDNDT